MRGVGNDILIVFGVIFLAAAEAVVSSIIVVDSIDGGRRLTIVPPSFIGLVDLLHSIHN